MKTNRIIVLIVFLLGTFLFVMLNLDIASAQDSKELEIGTTESNEKKELNTRNSKVPATKELILEEIQIEAVIEKPRVAILPKRREPDFGKIEFVDRSFENELKKIPHKPMFIEEDLMAVQKIRKLNILKKKKNKAENEVKDKSKENN